MAGKPWYGLYDEETLKDEVKRAGELRWSVYCKLSSEGVSDLNIKRMFGISTAKFDFWKKGHKNHFESKGLNL